MLDIIINPFITILLFLYQILGGNVVLAIVLFTILIRLATFPLIRKQQQSTKAMQELQPELKKLQEKHKNDRERMAQAQMELYKEYGVNPLAGCLPALIQLPIMLGLYRAITTTLAATPLELLNLSDRLWVADLSSQIPLHNKFLWLNLAVPDPLYVLPILVVATTYLYQRLLMPTMTANSNSNGRDGSGNETADQAAQISRQMMIIMPFMFGFFSLQFASGLSIYFIASNFIGIGQSALMGKIDFRAIVGLSPKEDEIAAEKAKRDGDKGKRVDDDTLAPLPAKPRPIANKRQGIYDSRLQRAKTKSKAKG